MASVLTFSSRERRARPKIQQYMCELMFWICTACGGADVIRILNFDEQDDSEDDNNKDMNHST